MIIQTVQQYVDLTKRDLQRENLSEQISADLEFDFTQDEKREMDILFKQKQQQIKKKPEITTTHEVKSVQEINNQPAVNEGNAQPAHRSPSPELQKKIKFDPQKEKEESSKLVLIKTPSNQLNIKIKPRPQEHPAQNLDQGKKSLADRIRLKKDIKGRFQTSKLNSLVEESHPQLPTKQENSFADIQNQYTNQQFNSNNQNHPRQPTEHAAASGAAHQKKPEHASESLENFVLDEIANQQDLCTFFPHCQFGDKCNQKHPPCQYAEKCSQPDCQFSHNGVKRNFMTSAMPFPPHFPFYPPMMYPPQFPPQNMSTARPFKYN